MDKEALTTHLISLYLLPGYAGFLVLSYGLILDVFTDPLLRDTHRVVAFKAVGIEWL